MAVVLEHNRSYCQKRLVAKSITCLYCSQVKTSKRENCAKRQGGDYFKILWGGQGLRELQKSYDAAVPDLHADLIFTLIM